ncbi:MAG: PEP/pyruvate-binding domain-containing protein [Patescibacteria group bacterium]
MRQILFADDIREKHQDLVGAKAYKLAYLKQQDIFTANFFVVPNAISNRVLEKGISIDIQKNILLGLKDMLSDRLAIRSSATCEDGHNSSFAGQFDSYLNISKKEAISAIENCFKALQNEHVSLYCDFHKIDPSEIKMAVMVQDMIQAEKGGVLFGQNPIGSNHDEVVIEAAEGLGEQVVSGSDFSQKLVYSLAKKKILSEKSETKTSVLSNREVDKLILESQKIQKVLGSPQDIEWAIQDDKIYILQSRPIT